MPYNHCVHDLAKMSQTMGKDREIILSTGDGMSIGFLLNPKLPEKVMEHITKKNLD